MTKKKISIPVFIASILLACIVTFQITAIAFTGVGAKTKPSEDPGTNDTTSEPETDGFLDRVKTRLSELDSKFRSLYVGELDEDELTDWILRGYVYGTGDEFADYYNEEEYNSFMDELAGEGEGIGIYVIYNSDYRCIEVINVFPDSAAEEAGLKVGDLIEYVGEEKEAVSDLGYYPAIAKLRGKAGTDAVFTVTRGEDLNETVDFRITRRQYTIVNVFYHVYEPDPTVGVIKIAEFDTPVPDDVADAIGDLLAKGCDKIVFDLRNNPGGELISIVDTLDYLLPSGPIIRIFDKDGNLVDQYDSDPSSVDVPMAILTNHSTASAAELFTAALRDYEKAKVIGTTTYGKGCMQTTTHLPSGGAVSVTYRMFKPPFSESYHKIGIVPDIEVELDEIPASKNLFKVTDEEDNQLRAAVESFYSD